MPRRVNTIISSASASAAPRVGPRQPFLRVHWLSDVAGGWLFGTGWLAPAEVESHRSGPKRLR
nr:hypothetical protein OG781_04390 [Streptomyces sp. NBC_00830]